MYRTTIITTIKAKQSRAEHSRLAIAPTLTRAKQSKAKQSKAKQSKAEQSNTSGARE